MIILRLFSVSRIFFLSRTLIMTTFLFGESKGLVFLHIVLLQERNMHQKWVHLMYVFVDIHICCEFHSTIFKLKQR
jgi:hypothetical protein